MKKRQGIKTLLGLALASVMVVGMVGCGDKTPASTSQEQSSTPAPSSQQLSSTVASTEEVVEAVTYPLDTDGTLEVYGLCRLYSGATKWQDQPFCNHLEEATGVHVNYNYAPKGADLAQHLNLMWVGDVEDMYHIVHTQTLDAQKGSEYIEEGLIWDLTDYLAEYAPNFWEWINKEENAVDKSVITTADGRFYMIPSIGDEASLTWIGPVIRQDWLDECGLDKPVTVEDLEEVLVAFKEKYNAKLGFVFKEGGSSAGLIASGFDSLGFAVGDTGSLMFRLNKEGEIVVPYTEPEWLEMMETLVDWWDRGLIDEDSLTVDRNGLRTKALNNELGVIWTAASSITQFVSDAESQGIESNWVGMEYLRTEPGAPVITARSRALRANGFGSVVTKRCSEEELILALKWLDYGWTEEGRFFWAFGKEGVAWEMVDGMPQFTDTVKNHELGFTEGLLAYTGLSDNGPVMQVVELAGAKADEVTAEARKLWVTNQVAREHYIPTLKLSEEDNEKANDIFSFLEPVMKDYGVAFLTGEKPLSEYDAFIKKLYNLGLQDAIDIYTKAYNEMMGE